jgi:flagellar biosynthesis/type III secretory pathway protein FliH
MPRAAEQIQRDIRVALEHAYEQGLRDGQRNARARLLTEHAAIVTGMRQALEARAKTLEIELNELAKDPAE